MYSVHRFTKCDNQKEMTMDRSIIGLKLRKLRGNRSQKEIADGIGVLQSTYCMYETGQRIPSDDVKEKIATYFDDTVQNIFFSTEISQNVTKAAGA